jgi:hypothetical protein
MQLVPPAASQPQVEVAATPTSAAPGFHCRVVGCVGRESPTTILPSPTARVAPVRPSRRSKPEGARRCAHAPLAASLQLAHAERACGPPGGCAGASRRLRVLGVRTVRVRIIAARRATREGCRMSRRCSDRRRTHGRCSLRPAAALALDSLDSGHAHVERGARSACLAGIGVVADGFGVLIIPRSRRSPLA